MNRPERLRGVWEIVPAPRFFLDIWMGGFYTGVMEAKIYLLTQENQISNRQVERHVLGVFPDRESAQKAVQELAENNRWIYEMYREMHDERCITPPEVEIDKNSIFVDFSESWNNSFISIDIDEKEVGSYHAPWLNADYIK